ncbi:MAG TPA: 2OG-Fe dioxygenase family protein [Micromonosporaceae bacterium]
MTARATTFLVPTATDPAGAAEQIAKFGFVHVEAGEFGDLPRAELARFAASWDDLVPDTALLDGGRYRLRRYGRLKASWSGDQLRFAPLGHAPFRQDTNPLYRGTARMFEPITAEVLADPVLRHLVGFDVTVASRLHRLDSWQVGLHQIRIVARDGDAGLPTPEGRHRDGHLFVGMHMLARTGCSGGHSIIEQNDGTLWEFTLTRPLDTVIVADGAVTHEVTAIRAGAGAPQAVRDMLLVDLNPLEP